MNNIERKKIEQEIYDQKTGLGKIEWGAWWDPELYSYLEGFRKKIIQQWYDQYLKNKDCLVLGCGNGEDIKDFEKLSSKIVGIDISSRLIKEATKKFKRHYFILGDAENLPFKNKSFDIVLCKSILHHLPNLEKALNEINRILKKNGILLIAYEPCLLNPPAIIGRKFFPSNIHTPGERPFIPYIFRKKLKKQGYSEIYFEYFYFWSNILPIIGKYYRFKDFFKVFIKTSIILEKLLKFTPLREFYWIIAGVYIGGKDL